MRAVRNEIAAAPRDLLPERHDRVGVVTGADDQPYAQPVGLGLGLAQRRAARAEAGERTARDMPGVEAGAVAKDVVRQLVRGDDGELVVGRRRLRHPSGNLDVAPVGMGVQPAPGHQLHAGRATAVASDRQRPLLPVAAQGQPQRTLGQCLLDQRFGARHLRVAVSGGERRGRVVDARDRIANLQPGALCIATGGDRGDSGQRPETERRRNRRTRRRVVLGKRLHREAGKPTDVGTQGDVGGLQAQSDRRQPGIGGAQRSEGGIGDRKREGKQQDQATTPVVRGSIARYRGAMFNDTSSTLALLATRRSGKPRDMIAPGPDDAQLHAILAAAIRVPDHGKLNPWRFVVIDADRRDRLAELLLDAYRATRPEPGRLELEAITAFAHQAPTLVVALSAPVAASKIDRWEQELSAGAAIMALLVATHAHGFVGGWLTGWAAYDERVRDAFGAVSERIAGFIFIGTPARPLDERPRPDFDAVVGHWQG